MIQNNEGRYEKSCRLFLSAKRRLIAATIQFFDLFSGIGGFREGLRFLKLKDPRILSLKMFPVCYRMTKAGRFAPSSVRFLNWGTMSNGKCLTARISESPKQESGCILSDILISDVPEKYYLNQKQMEQLLFKSGQEVREKESTVQKD